jgi:predicted O-methyltransferase YrrM
MTDYPNWFKQIAQHNFERFLLPEAGKPDLNYLQLGVFTGDASLWLLENALTGKGSTLTDVDTWEGAFNEPIQEEMDFENVYDTYTKKVGKYPNATHLVTSTQDFLLEYIYRDNRYDFIYVDAHHTAASAFLDCELSWSLLKSGGMMAIDDYEWTHPDGVEIHAPKLGIHMFLDRHPGEFDTLIVNQQYWLRKQ